MFKCARSEYNTLPRLCTPVSVCIEYVHILLSKMQSSWKIAHTRQMHGARHAVASESNVSAEASEVRERVTLHHNRVCEQSTLKTHRGYLCWNICDSQVQRHASCIVTELYRFVRLRVRACACVARALINIPVYTPLRQPRERHPSACTSGAQ